MAIFLICTITMGMSEVGGALLTTKGLLDIGAMSWWVPHSSNNPVFAYHPI
jgi:hypothetical protein